MNTNLERNVNAAETEKWTGMRVNDEMRSLLTTTYKWSKFVAIVGFVEVGIIVLTGLAMLLFSSSMAALGLFAKQTSAMADPSLIVICYGVVYLILGAICFFPSYWLYQFAVRAKRAFLNNDEAVLTKSFVSMKNFWLFMGILTIVTLVFAILMIIMFIAIFATMPAVDIGTFMSR